VQTIALDADAMQGKDGTVTFVDLAAKKGLIVIFR